MQPAEGISPVVSLGPDSPVTSGSSPKMPDQKHFIERKNGHSGAVGRQGDVKPDFRFTPPRMTAISPVASGLCWALSPPSISRFEARGVAGYNIFTRASAGHTCFNGAGPPKQGVI